MRAPRLRAVRNWTLVLMLGLVVAMALFVAFGMNLLKGPIARAVSEASGRELVIEGDLRTLWSWTHPRFRAERVRFANADWGQEEQLFSAESLVASVRLLPLLRGRVVLPELHLEGAQVNLELDAQGQKNWVLGREPREDEAQKASRVVIERLMVDRGQLKYGDARREIDIQADLHTTETGLVFATKGRYRGLPLSASGEAGHVLSLRDASAPFPLKGEARIGETSLKLDGQITELVGLKGIDARVQLDGKSLSHLYGILKVAFPETAPYSTSGRLIREGEVVRYENFTGKVGDSDVSGSLQVHTGGKRPFMEGNVKSRVIDLADLGILVGTNQPRKDGVLPDAPFDPGRWDSVDADVRIKAGTVKRPKQLPIDDLSARIQMNERVLTLNPLEFGIAGGKLAGPVKLDGSRETIRADVRMRVQRLQLGKLFPAIEENKSSVGNLSGLVELTGSGNSVGRMLASANGKIGVFMDGGGISRFLMELAALDLWDVARLKLNGDEQIAIRCAVADFAVKNGLMETNAFVFDTAVVVIEGGGVVDLKTEEMNFRLHPKPKDSSVASLNSPLYVSGRFGKPKISQGKEGGGALTYGACRFPT